MARQQTVRQIIRYFSLMMLFVVLFQPVANARVKTQPMGYWTTIDDKTKLPRGIVHLYYSRGKLYGKIVRTYPRPGDLGYCKKCPKPFTNKPIVGLRFLWDLTQTSNPLVWSGGQILDPKSGRIYRAKLTVSKDGKTLDVRGYIGISLFGRTQTWVRRDKL